MKQSSKLMRASQDCVFNLKILYFHGCETAAFDFDAQAPFEQQYSKNTASQEHTSKDFGVDLTYQAQRRCESGEASREPGVSLPFIYLSDQASCALNSYSSQPKFTRARHSFS